MVLEVLASSDFTLLLPIRDVCEAPPGLQELHHIDDNKSSLFVIFSRIERSFVQIMSSKEGELKAGHPPAGTLINFSVTHFITLSENLRNFSVKAGKMRITQHKAGYDTCNVATPEDASVLKVSTR